MAAVLRAKRSMNGPPILVHRDLTERVIGCFYDVYRELGPGFSELVLRRAMMIALHEAGLRAEEEVRLQVQFRGVVIGTFFADIVVDGAVIKALPELDNRAVGQLLNYLKVAGGGV